MKSLRKITLLSTLTAPLLCPFLAHATLDTTVEHGASVVSIGGDQGRAPDLCYMPKHLEFPSNYEQPVYTEADLEKETSLCAIDQYTKNPACPKTNSTNPGVDFFKLPDGMTPEEVTKDECYKAGTKRDKKGKLSNEYEMIAKYKMSTSCSYTPSILGYYHVSRMLGDIDNVPQAVLRTADIKWHVKIAEEGASLTTKSGDSLIHSNFETLLSKLEGRSGQTSIDQMLVKGSQQSYGALLDTPKTDDNDPLYSSQQRGDTSRTQAFKRRNPYYLALENTNSVEQIVGSGQFDKAHASGLQKMVYMRDAANMIILDSLLNQQDRMGNVDTKPVYYYIQSGELKKVDQKTQEKKAVLTPEELASAILVNEVVLKDNDCGVIKSNLDEQNLLAEGLSHIDPNTYRRLLQMNALADQQEMKDFFSKDLLFTANDYSNSKTGFRANLAKLAKTLEAKCKANTLKLDLDVNGYYTTGKIAQQSCSL